MKVSYEEFKKMVDSPAWQDYKESVLAEARTWRVLADQPQMKADDRLYLFAKAQGLDEAINQADNLLKQEAKV